MESESRIPPLRAVREAQGLALTDVAARAGIDKGQLSRIERGKEGLSLEALARLAGVLELRELTRLLAPYRKGGGAIETPGRRARKPARMT